MRVEAAEAHQDHAHTGLRTEQLRRDRQLVAQRAAGIAGRLGFETFEQRREAQRLAQVRAGDAGRRGVVGGARAETLDARAEVAEPGLDRHEPFEVATVGKPERDRLPREDRGVVAGERHAGHGCTLVELVAQPAEKAGGRERCAVGVPGAPTRRHLEMGSGRVGSADAVDERDAGTGRRQVAVDREAIVQTDQLVHVRQRRVAQTAQRRVVVGDERRHPIVAPFELDHHQRAVRLVAGDERLVFTHWPIAPVGRAGGVAGERRCRR